MRRSLQYRTHRVFSGGSEEKLAFIVFRHDKALAAVCRQCWLCLDQAMKCENGCRHKHTPRLEQALQPRGGKAHRDKQFTALSNFQRMNLVLQVI